MMRFFSNPAVQQFGKKVLVDAAKNTVATGLGLGGVSAANYFMGGNNKAASSNSGFPGGTTFKPGIGKR